MNNGGSIWLLSSLNEVQTLSKFKKPEFEQQKIILPIVYDEKSKNFIIDLQQVSDEILLNKRKIEGKTKTLQNGDIITYKGYNFRVELYDLEQSLNFNTFWHENLYLGNLPVFSEKAFEKLIEIEIQKAKRYKYPFSIVLFRFSESIEEKSKDIDKIICENIRFTDMLSKISSYEYLLYLHQVKKENICKIIEKINNLLKDLLDLDVEFSNGIEFDEKFESYNDILFELYKRFKII